MATKPTIATVVLNHVKDTKGTYVFAAADPEAAVTQLYVRKNGMPNGAPSSITLTIS